MSKQKEIPIPQKFREIRLHQWLSYHKATNDGERVAAITGLSEQEVRQIPTDVSTVILNQFYHVATKEEATFTPTVRLNGTHYGFIPKLTDISLGEYLDLISLCADLDKNYQRVFAILYRPVTVSLGSKYQIADYDDGNGGTKTDEYMTDIGLLPMNVCRGAIAFFLTLRIELAASFHGYSQRAAEATTT
jgi:hypothetical protein